MAEVVEILLLECQPSPSVWSLLLAFDVNDSQCFDPNEESKLKMVIDAVGRDRFNGNVRELAAACRAQPLGVGRSWSDS